MMKIFYKFKVGTIIVVTGNKEYNPEEYLAFGRDRSIITLMEL
ncbi:MAG: hypothetical protein ACTSRU_10510 [Candidatus Hodarchaeales archaeon]